MPRLYLAFNTVSEKEDYEVALKAYDYKFALDDLDEFLRHKLKYDGDLAVAKQKVYQEVRDKLHEIMDEASL
jgi:hypothetical protein